MNVVLRTQSLSEAYALRAALEAAGIPSAVNGEHSLGTIGGGLSVVVLRDADVEAAREVVRAAEPTEPSKDENQPDGPASLAGLAAGRRALVRRVLHVCVCLLLVLLSWWTIAGGLRQLPRAHTLGQRAETVVQPAGGLLSLLVVLTSFRWRRWGRAIQAAWAGSLALMAGLSSLVWGPPMLLVGVVFAAGALALALGIIRALRATGGAS